MTRRRRTEILIRGNRSLSAQLAGEVRSAYAVTTVEAPNEGLVMIRLREGAQGSVYNMGEVLVTEARVQIDRNIGRGIVAGYKPDLAFDLAVIDAAYSASLPATQQWDELLEDEQQHIDHRRSAQEREILQTKVDFQSMDREA